MEPKTLKEYNPNQLQPSLDDYAEAHKLVNQYDAIVDGFKKELFRAKKLHGPRSFNSYHEGYAVLLEEVDEVWDEIKKKQPDVNALRKELTQVGAMVFRFIHELT